MPTHRYTVTVNRINEAAHADPYYTMDAETVILTPDGELEIKGKLLAKSFSLHAWDSVEIVKHPVKISTDYA